METPEATPPPSTSEETTSPSSVPQTGPDGAPLTKNAIKKMQKEQEKAAKKAERAAKAEAERTTKEATVTDYALGNYGKKPMNQSQEELKVPREKIKDISASREGETIHIRARVHTSRATGNKMCFFVLRQGFDTIQCLVTENKETISRAMIKFATSIPLESIVLIEAVVKKPLELVRSCTVQDAELDIQKLFVISEAQGRLIFSLEDASRPETEFEKDDAQFSRVGLDTRLNNRILDLRTTTNQAIFRIQSAVCKIFRDFLLTEDFIEIHTPKILGAATEGGASVFRVQYFETNAYLAQSPQFYKQMCVAADFDRVFEIAPVFRAENANTHRHMTEFVGLDLEMAFQESYHEVLDLFDRLFVYMFEQLQTKYKAEIEAVRRQYPFEDFKYLPKAPRLKYPEAVKMLREAGVEMDDYEDLTTANEKKLGALVKEKYGVDFFMLDKFPLDVRPFYTMPDPNNPGYSNAYDFFMRGEEILSGGQRVHDPEFLVERAKAKGVDPVGLQPYVDAFRIGAPPHAGGGIGLERVVMLYLGIGNIRRTSLFPRDPKRLVP